MFFFSVSFFFFFPHIPKVKAAAKLQHRFVLTEAAGKDWDVKNDWALQKALVIYMQKQTLPILYLCPQTVFFPGNICVPIYSKEGACFQWPFLELEH